ncbi:hypothetical protein ACPCSG_23715 [Streptomyces cellulosae]
MAHPWKAGDFITWPGMDNDCFRLVTADPGRITYEAWDGVCQSVEDTQWSSAAEKAADWTPATPGQVARWRSLHRPAPVNWD